MRPRGQIVREMIEQAGIPVVDRGPNVKRNNFNVHCPLCGAADPSHHMGIDADTGWWACWRNKEHRGKSPIRLLVAITGKPVWQLREMLGMADSPDLALFADIRRRLTHPGVEDIIEPITLEMPKEFRRLKTSDPRAERFLEYVRGRGFTGPAERRVLGDYDLHYAVAGDQRDRVILPFYFGGSLVTWTGRSINGSDLRYRDLDKVDSVIYKNQMLYNYDEAALGGTALIVLEGPFDVVKGDYAGRPHGVRCVGLGTNTMSNAQLALLVELADAYEKVFLCLDTPTAFNALETWRMCGKLNHALPIKPLNAARLGKDVGGAPIRAVSDFFKEVQNATLNEGR